MQSDCKELNQKARKKNFFFCDHEVWTQVSKQSRRMSTIRFWWWQSTSCLYLGQKWFSRKIEKQPLQSSFVALKYFEKTSKVSNLKWFYTFFAAAQRAKSKKGSFISTHVLWDVLAYLRHDNGQYDWKIHFLASKYVSDAESDFESNQFNQIRIKVNRKTYFSWNM